MLHRLIVILVFLQISTLNISAQQNYTNLVVRVNYRYLDLDLIDNPSFDKFRFNEILNKKGKEQLKALESHYSNLGNYKLTKIFGFMSWKDSISISRQGTKVTIPPFWATFTLNVPQNEDYRKLMVFLNKAAPLIDYAEPSFPVEMQSPPNDSLYSRQKSLNGTTALPFAGINVEEAWELETGEQFIKVGVLDSGIDSTHPDLNVLFGGTYYKTNGTYYEFGVDTESHGTGVAGIIASKRNNETGIAGIAGGNNTSEKGVSLIDLKYPFINNSGNEYICAAVVDGARSVGSYWNYADSSNYYTTVDGEYDNTNYFRKTPGFGIHIGNHSYAIKIAQPIPTIEDKVPSEESNIEANCKLCREAYLFSLKNGVINVVARANSGHNPPDTQSPTYVQTLYPQAFPDNWIVSVGASGYDGTTVRTGINQSPSEVIGGFYSLYGGNMDLIAPGSDSIVYTTRTTFWGGPLYQRFNGTSAAAPHVSGVVGLLVSHYNTDCYSNRNLSIEDVEYILQESATDVLDPDFDIISGAGRLDAGKAIKMIDYPKKQIVHPDSLINSEEIERDTIALKYNAAFVAEGWGPISRVMQLTSNKNYKVVRVAYENTYSFAEFIQPSTEILGHWARESVSNSTEFYLDTTTSLSAPNVWQFDNFEMNPYVEITDFNTTTKTIKLKGYYYHFIEQYLPNSFLPDEDLSIDLWYPANPQIDSAKMGFSIYLQDSTLTSLFDFPCISDNILYDSTYVPYQNTSTIDENDIDAVKIYPNPVNEILKIDFKGFTNGEKKLTLMDLQGKLIETWITNDEKFEIQMTELNRGIYILDYTTDKNNKSFKIIKL